jgi:hypothetical protein
MDMDTRGMFGVCEGCLAEVIEVPLALFYIGFMLKNKLGWVSVQCPLTYYPVRMVLTLSFCPFILLTVDWRELKGGEVTCFQRFSGI